MAEGKKRLLTYAAVSYTHLDVYKRQVQVVVFLIVSVLLFIWTRPVAVRYFNKDRAKTNVDSLIGRKAVVLEKIDNLHGAGRAEIDGIEWTARAADDAVIFEKDEIVQVAAVQGVKLIVKRPVPEEEGAKEE